MPNFDRDYEYDLDGTSDAHSRKMLLDAVRDADMLELADTEEEEEDDDADDEDEDDEDEEDGDDQDEDE